MADTSVRSVEPLQNGEDTSFHNPHDTLKVSSSDKIVDRQPATQPGDEENAKNGNHISKRQSSRFQVFKRMRLGRSPFKQSKSKMSKFSDNATREVVASKPMFFDPTSNTGRESTSKRVSTSNNGHDTSSIASKSATVDIGKRVLFDPLTDSLAFSPERKVHNAPELEKAPSVESSTESLTATSSTVSGNSRNWLDDYGKQGKGNIGATENLHSAAMLMPAPAKDPRFHCQRKAKTQPEQLHVESAKPGLFPSDPMSGHRMEDSQVYLAPVIVPPVSIGSSDRRASWHPEPKEEPVWDQTLEGVSWSQAEKEEPSSPDSSDRRTSWNLEPKEEPVWDQGLEGVSRSQAEKEKLSSPDSSDRRASWNPEPQEEPSWNQGLGEVTWSQAEKEEVSWNPEQFEEPSWNEAPNEEPSHTSFTSPAAKGSSAFQASPAAIAAAQGEPELAASSSQETSSSESNSVGMSAITSSTTSSMASALVKRLVVSSASKDTTKARLQRQSVRSTPIRIKPRVKPQEVQATDQGYASVAKLSAWLADDPTSTKKVRHVRRGANVIAKSRKFEKDLEGVIVEENNISSGAVKEKKNWLKHAFVHEEEEQDEYDELLHHDPNRHMMMMRTRPVNFDDDCTRSEFVVKDDAASVISVSNKKKWLQNAFKKEDEDESNKKRPSYRAQSDIGPVRESRDEITSRAKKMWQHKSEKRAEGPPSAKKPPTPYRGNPRPPPSSREAMPRRTLEDKMRASLGSRASAPAHTMVKAANAVATEDRLASRHSVVGIPVEEDTTPVDFRAARQLLIQRSKNNGNEVKVSSKVSRKANKFERINKDAKRRTSAMGLLKPTWESNVEDDLEGPSDAYTKAFLEDNPPQRSFDELP